MSISDLYASGTHKENKSHFASIVRLALVDNVIKKGEQKLLVHLAKGLGITQEEYKDIFKNHHKYPIEPPVSYDDRIERLFNLTKMILADNEIGKNQVFLLQKIAMGLGFLKQNVKRLNYEAIHLVMNEVDLDEFIIAIKKLNVK
jgi:DNA polymerase III psi subunit